MTRQLMLIALTVGGLTAAGCGGDTSTAPDDAAAVASVELTPATTTLSVNRTLTLTATARSASGAVLSGRTVTWSAAPTNIATVTTAGVVSGVAVGTATITATIEGKRAERSITVQPLAVSSVEIGTRPTMLRTGDTLRLAATTRADNGDVLTGRPIIWRSNAPLVASIDSLTGLVTALTAGSVTFSATSEGETGRATITVTARVATVTVNAALDTLEAFDVVPLSATLRDGAGNVLTGREVRWKSSNAAVAAIDSVTGQLTGIERGTVIITATSEEKNGSATRVVVIKYRSLTTGSSHACDIASGGVVWCWGLNGFEGRIGGTELFANSYRWAPLKLNTTVRFAQLSTYGTTTCGVAVDGQGYCWGSNAASLLGDGTYVTQRSTPSLIVGGHRFKQISVGSQHVCGITVAGKAYCWGANSDGQLATGNKSWTTTPVPSAASLTFASITTGTDFTCAVTPAGAGYCWGYSGMGNLGDGAPPSLGNTNIINPTPITGGHTFRSLSATNQVTCGVTTTGQGLCWGRGEGMRLGNDVSVPSSIPAAVAGGHAFRSISAGATAVCGIRTDDQPWCWGLNSHGQLGQQLANGSATPIRVGSLLRVSEISAAQVGGGTGAFTCAISPDRLTTVCWGRNDVGQLGNGAITSPQAVNAVPTIVQGQKPLS